MDLRASSALAPFAVWTKSADVELQVRVSGDLTNPVDQTIFNAGQVWTLSRGTEDLTFSFSAPQAPHWGIYRQARIDRSFCRGEILVSRATAHLHPFGYPLDELFFIHRLSSQSEGVLLHACGLVNEQGQGLLFVGMSGAGKTTMARLWAGQPKIRILSDDRIIVRMINGQPWIYGTPWHGEGCYADPQSAPLHRIFVLRHAADNQILPLEPATAVAQLLARSFVPFHDPKAISFTMACLQDLIVRVPCQELGFVPDQTAVVSVRNAA